MKIPKFLGLSVKVSFMAFAAPLAAQTGTNLLSVDNPGFESGLADWQGAGFANASIDVANPGDGLKSAKLAANSTNSWNVLVNTGGTIPITAGNAYVLSALAHQNLADGTALLGFSEMNASQTPTQYTWGTVSDAAAWHSEYVTLVPRSDTAYLRVYLWVSQSSTAGASWWDHLQMDGFPNPFLTDANASLQVSLPTVVFDYDGSSIAPDTLTPVVKLGSLFAGGVVAWKLVKETDGANGTPVLQDAYAVTQAGNWEWPIDMDGIAQLGAGRYLFTITAVTADGLETGSITKPLAVVSNVSSLGTVAPGAVTSSTIDASGRLLVNGQPFQAVMYYQTFPAEYAVQRDLGANLVEVTGNSVCALSAAVTQAWNAGLYSMVVLAQPPFTSGTGAAETWSASALASAVSTLGGLPGVLGWTLCDEPNGLGIPASAVQSAYTTLKTLDPNHVIWVNLTSNSSTYGTYTGVSDLASYDSYVFPFGDLSTVSSLNAAIKQSNPGKPLVSVLQTYGSVGFPSFTQLRAELYTDVCDGMVHPFYYAWMTSPYNGLWNETETQSYTQLLNWEMQQLQPFLFATAAPLSVTVSNSTVKAIAKSVGAGVVLVLVNQSSSPISGVMATVAGRSFGTSAAFFPGTSPGTLSGGNLMDTLPAYGVGVYQLQ